MELRYCTCGHREGMHSARDGGCFEHGCPCTHFVQRDYIPCQEARAELLTRAHVPCYADSCMDKLKKAATKLAIAQSRVEALRAALEDGFVVACDGPGLQREMAKRLGISDQYVSDIVRGRREISDAVVRKIVEAK